MRKTSAGRGPTKPRRRTRESSKISHVEGGHIGGWFGRALHRCAALDASESHAKSRAQRSEEGGVNDADDIEGDERK